MDYRSPRLPRRRSILLSAFALALFALAAATAVASPHRVRAADGVSPLLWGENLTLDSSSDGDWFLDNPSLRNALKSAHTQILRMPVRGPDPDTAGWSNQSKFETAAGYVRQLGMVPLVILRNPEAPQSLDTDQQVIAFIRGLFGDQTVYYEFGNETDLQDGTGNFVTAASYVSHWNQFVPTLKSAAGPGAKFLGPVSYQYDDAYLRTFLSGAQPRPDAISWHLYTCSTSESEDACLNAGGIDDWPAKFSQARATMQGILGTQLPIWVTEWNFNPGGDVGSDPKLRDQAFLRAWTLKALQTLADAGVVGSMHFNVADQVPLATSSGSLTSEGQAFKDKYEELVGSGASAPPSSSPAPSASSPASPSPSPSPSPSTGPTSPGPGPRYSFEDGSLDGWSKTGNVSSYATSTDIGGKDGTHALRITFASADDHDLPYLHVNPSNGPVAGHSYSAYVYIPSGTSTTVTVKLYVQKPDNSWQTSNDTVISPRGTWVPLAFTPSGYSGSAKQVGVQFFETPANTAVTVYLDAVDWS